MQEDLVQPEENIETQARIILNMIAISQNIEGNKRIGELWRPKKDDFHQVFKADVAEKVYHNYEVVFASETPYPYANAGQTSLLLGLSKPESFANSRIFPHGYQGLEEYLNPNITWLAWKFVEPGKQRGLAYNGLVWLEDRFVWFPKPWKLLPEE